MAKKTNIPFSFNVAFDQAFADMAREFDHDRTQSLGASEVFACMRRSYYAKFVYPDRAIEEWGMMERGNILENSYMVPYLYHIFGKENCLYMGDEQISLFDKLASATPDGMLINQPRDILSDYGVPDIGPSQSLVTEFKSFDPRANLYEVKPIHSGQAVMQMGMFRKGKQYPNPNYAMVFYVNASNVRDIRTFVVPFQKKTYNLGLKRADQLFEAKAPEDCMAEGAFSGECEYCPFTDDCKAANVRQFNHNTNSGTFTKADVNRMSRLVGKRSTAKKREEKATQERKKADEEVKKMMHQIDRTSMESDTYKINLAKVSGRETLDFDAMEKDGIDVSKYMKSGGEYTRLTITEK